MRYSPGVTRRFFIFDDPDRFVTGTVGKPGQRTFFLQAVQGGRIASVVLEKVQVAVLAERIAAILVELQRRGVAAESLAAVGDDERPLDEPLREEFRVATLTISWDSDEAEVLLEARSGVIEDEDEEDDEDDEDDTEPLEVADDGRGRGRGRDPRRRPRGSRCPACAALTADGPGVRAARHARAGRRSPGLPVLRSAAQPRRAHLPAQERLPELDRMADREPGSGSWRSDGRLSTADALRALTEGTLEIKGRLVEASNTTLLLRAASSLGGGQRGSAARHLQAHPRRAPAR